MLCCIHTRSFLFLLFFFCFYCFILWRRTLRNVQLSMQRILVIMKNCRHSFGIQSKGEFCGRGEKKMKHRFNSTKLKTFSSQLFVSSVFPVEWDNEYVVSHEHWTENHLRESQLFRQHFSLCSNNNSSFHFCCCCCQLAIAHSHTDERIFGFYHRMKLIYLWIFYESQHTHAHTIAQIHWSESSKSDNVFCDVYVWTPLFFISLFPRCFQSKSINFSLF